jgi:glycosyltransferase involved in cell wall biosynthesis
MRIGYDITSIQPRRTGVGHYCLALLRALIARHPDIRFSGFSSGRSKPPVAALGLNIPHKHIGVPTRVMYHTWECFGAPHVDYLLGGVDIYHATNFFLPPARSAVRVLTIHDLAFLVEPSWGSPKIVGPYSRNMRKFANDADMVLACSEATRRDVIRLLNVPEERVMVTLEAAMDDMPAIGPEEGREIIRAAHGLSRPYLLFVGTLEPRKNIGNLVRAYARAARSVTQDLVLVGAQGWMTENAMEIAAQEGVGDRVFNIPYISNREELAAWYSGADAFLFPSHYEGFGLPILEAMKCGCPVLTSNVSSMPEVAGDAAVYVDPRDVDDMARKIEQIAADEPLRTRLRDAGPAQAARFSWDKCAEATMAGYQKALANRRG